jgi:hypothetical protein
MCAQAVAPIPLENSPMTISGKLTLSLAGAAVIGFCGYAAAQMNSANHPLHTNHGTSRRAIP